ncbi:MAG: hypothetical protein EBU37_07130 [Actinobacteria bacterium]|nr:hypothetical protein [Actinomycetota bacterium]
MRLIHGCKVKAVTLQLSVDSAAWGRHVSETANSLGDLIPVVKGNGYGFGRPTLIEHAKKLSSDIAVGTIFEANDVPSDCRAFVLTPVGKVLPPAKNLAKNNVLTIGAIHHVENLRDADWHGDVVIKLRSSMNRYGANPSELGALIAAERRFRFTMVCQPRGCKKSRRLAQKIRQSKNSRS